jgi:ketopantoate reductase
MEARIITASMRIQIMGPGAVGTLLGGLLSLKGHDISLRGRKAPTIQAGALRVMLPDRWLLVEGVRRLGPEPSGYDPDLLFITLARHHVHALRRPDFARVMGSGEAPVAAFNVDPLEMERLAVPPERLRLCLSLMCAVMLQENDVELAAAGPTLLYERSPLLAGVFKQLGGYGFKLVAVDDARPYLNSLLIWQLLMLPVAMCNTNLECFLSSAEGRELAHLILDEGFSAMQRAGLPLAALPAMDPHELVARIDRKPGSFDTAAATPDRSYNTVLQCMLRGRPTEAAQVNRKIVEIASSAGLHLTWNWRILQKAGRVSGVGFFQGPGDLLSSLS